MTRVDIVLPVFNEERDLARSVLRLRRFCLESMMAYGWRIVVADNASSDTTSEIGRILADQFNDVDYLRLEERGRGRALFAAWQASAADVVCYMDVDLSTELSALPALVAAVLQEGYDIATGSRLTAGANVTRSLKREVLSRGYNILLKWFLQVDFKDAQCGFKAIRRSLVSTLLPQVQDRAWFFDSELLIKAQWQGLRIKEIPVRWIEDLESRVKIWQTSWNYVRSIARLRRERHALLHPGGEDGGLIGLLLSRPEVSDAIRWVLEGGMSPIKRRVRAALARHPQGRVLDVGCGSGMISQLVAGEYQGIDVDKPFIEYAQRRYGNTGRVRFAVQTSTTLPFPDQSFDQALLISVIHHLNDAQVSQTLQELARVARHQIIVMDMAPLKYNVLGMFFYSLDQGKFIRPIEQQAALVRRFVDVQASGYFRSGINLHSWFIGAPIRVPRPDAIDKETYATA